ncbi:MAG: type II toxin-antitoxin system RelE/ParE family toxin [Fluviicola sp.]|nr:type II toxin-antitoxin system RelE/ParE family toxin [Fluviicola sp.]
MSNKYKLTIKEEASFEISDAYEWYESKQVNLGGKFKKHLLKTFKSILANPMSFQVLFNNHRQAVVSKFPFVVIFETFDVNVVVYAVFHTSQDPKKKNRM